MRKLIVTEFIAADGVVEAPHEWHFPYFDDDMTRVVAGWMSDADGLLLGRTTYDGFAAAWPKLPADTPGAAEMNGIAKYVVSSTLEEPDWHNTTVVSGDGDGDGDGIADAIRALKERDGKNIIVMGSARLVQFLLAEGLVDEIDLLVHPIVVGKGQRLFEEGLATTSLRVVSSESFGSGVQHIVYAPTETETES
ncbi:dihydrofolate reductase family protein [Streptomyces sp. NPDC091292]|uniref:dihydrofolate reductase family protein n=1 Tax=Streptomyces sp. NPDC091292 TaxID=3365991 RepID=UPI00381E77DC